MNTKHSQLGTHYLDLETPALVVDLAAMEHNLRQMAEFFAGVPADLRPHTKTHRAPAIARLQIAAGAVGVCCGNLADAELMIDAGIDDVLVTREVVQPAQIARVAGLAGRSAIKLIVDDDEIVGLLDQAARAAGTRIGVLVDVDIQLGRSGVAPGEPALRLAQRVATARGLEFLGLMGYEGGMHQLSAAERAAACRAALTQLAATKDQVERAGLAVPIVSCGATSTYRTAASFPGITEVQAGSYLLGDGNYRRSLPESVCAISVLTSVISRPSAARVTIDAGQKAITAGGALPEPVPAGLRTVALHEEHGLLERDADAENFRVGEKIALTPGHAGTTIKLYDRIYAIRDERVAEIWEVGPISLRREARASG
jgi:D-serine deaminase-like pyridoxal phosphate-dependent protein